MQEFDFKVESYDVDLHPTSDGPTRSIRLEGSERDDPQGIAFLQFFPERRLRHRARLGLTEHLVSVSVDFRLDEYEPIYHLLQTERPVYLYAEYEESDDPIHSAESVGLTTELEIVGEGFEDFTL
ncbi:hypothetical protein ACFQH6_10635 [Halobacteriaceae archaeon GCM10025711]